MAARDLKVYLKTFSDASGLTKLGQHIRQHSVMVRGLGNAYKAAGAAGKAAFSVIGAQLRMLRNGALALTAALTGISIKGVASFMKQQDATEGLRASLVSLGYDAGKLMPQFEGLANEIQALTRIGDDEVMTLAGTLLNFGVMPEQIDKSVRGVIGLSKAMRMDLGSAAQYLALAQEGQFTMLARYIPALRTATTDAEKMAIVQGVMARGFEQAQASAGTLAGRWDQLKNRIGDLWEKIGQTVSESLNLTGAFQKAEAAVARLIDSAVFDKIAAGLRTAVSYVIVQVKTVYDLIQHLRSQDFGMTRIAEVGKTVVVELITMAVTLLLALLKANIAVFVALAKIVAAAFKEELLDVLRLIPGMTNTVEKMAYENYYKQSDAGKQGMAENLGFSDSKAMMREVTTGKRPDLIASMAAFNSGEGVTKAITEAGGKLKDTLKDVDAQWQKSKANMAAAAGKASGGTFNYGEAAADNRAELDTFFNTPQTAPLVSRRTAPRKSRAELERELEQLQMQATAAKMDQEFAAGQTPEEQRLAKWQKSNSGRNYASGSFAAQEGQKLSQAAQSSRQEANQAAEEAAATLASISGMMSTLVSGLKDLEGQMKNQP